MTIRHTTSLHTLGIDAVRSGGSKVIHGIIARKEGDPGNETTYSHQHLLVCAMHVHIPNKIMIHAVILFSYCVLYFDQDGSPSGSYSVPATASVPTPAPVLGLQT